MHDADNARTIALAKRVYNHQQGTCHGRIWDRRCKDQNCAPKNKLRSTPQSADMVILNKRRNTELSTCKLQSDKMRQSYSRHPLLNRSLTLKADGFLQCNTNHLPKNPSKICRKPKAKRGRLSH